MSRPVALFGVMTPGVGNFRLHTLVLAKALAAHRRVVVVGENRTVTQLGAEERAFLIGTNCAVTSVDDFIDDDHIRLYQLANNEPHRWILERFGARQGAVLLHDPSLYWLMRGTPFFNDHYVEREIGLLSSRLGARWINADRMSEVDTCLAHMIYFNRIVAEHAQGVVAHSEFAAERIREKAPGVPVKKLPLIMNTLDPARDIGLARRFASARDPRARTRFGVFGYMGHHKRIAETVDALSDMAGTHDFELVCAGKWDDHLRSTLLPRLDPLIAAGRAVVRNDYVPRAEMLRLMAECDFVISLRYPTAGESSGVAAECNAIATPIVYNMFSGFTEIDPTFNVPVSVAATKDELVRVLSALCGDQSASRREMRRERLKQAQRDYDHDFRRYGEVIASAIDEFERLPGRSYQLSAIASADPGHGAGVPVKLYVGKGRISCHRPPMTVDRFVATIEFSGESEKFRIASLAGDATWNLAFLVPGADLRAAGGPASPEETLQEFVTELRQLPLFGCVFTSTAVLARMMAVASVDASRSRLANLARRALKLDDREVFLLGLGLKLESVQGNAIVKAVKRSNVMERVFYDPRRSL